ncbi:hypothetical protein COB57_00670 [Candidatus Peregrinibacteria bacterium]|nr:MAG: hypothetical protein COB57_00670 [Candidatus Peregrinibacteria bacterium]
MNTLSSDVISQPRMEFLHEEFKNVFQSLNVEKSVDELWNKIVCSYGGNERHYHTLDHIAHLLYFLKVRNESLDNWPAVQLAVWFHDVIYDTQKKDNEKQSEEVAREELAILNISEDVIESVSQLILATKKHEKIRGFEDSGLFLDADLAVLGKDANEYQVYAEQIRSEYKWVDEDIYKIERVKILERFLARPHVYFTPKIRQSFEAQARKNILYEIKTLS